MPPRSSHPFRGHLLSDPAMYVYVATLFVMSVVLAWNVVRTGGIEESNRAIICQSRELREQFAPETALERAQLRNARRSASDCR